AEDGIRDFHVTGVQTCALPISPSSGLMYQVSTGGPDSLAHAPTPATRASVRTVSVVRGRRTEALLGIRGRSTAAGWSQTTPSGASSHPERRGRARTVLTGSRRGRRVA